MRQLNSIFSTKYASILSGLICITLLELLHLYNGYPLLMADSKGYIKLGSKFIETSHWSNTYIYFIGKNIQLFKTINWVPIIQNFLLVFVLFHLVKNVFRKDFHIKLVLVILFLLLTSLPWMSNVIMSDISTPISLMILMVLYNYKLKLTSYITLAVIFFFTASCHQSHIAIIPIFTFAIIGGNLLFKSNNEKLFLFKTTLLVFVLLFGSFQFEKNILNSSDKIIQTQEGISNNDITSGYYFVVVRMWEVGQLDKLLLSFCKNNQDNYLCDPNNNYPIKVKLTKAKDRNQNSAEYQKLSRDNKQFVISSLSNPRFYFACLKIALKRSPTLLKLTKIRPNAPIKGETFTRKIKEISKNEKARFLDSKQTKGFYIGKFVDTYALIDNIWWFVLFPMTIAFFFLESFLSKNIKSISKEKWIIIISLLVAHFVNIIICGTFSNYENPRYGSRTIWLVNLAIIFLFTFVLEARSQRKSRKV